MKECLYNWAQFYSQCLGLHLVLERDQEVVHHQVEMNMQANL